MPVGYKQLFRQVTRVKSFLMMHAVFLMLLLMMYGYADAAVTTVSCEKEACLDQPFEIVCDIDGGITSGMSWTRPDTIEVVTCDRDLTNCYVNVQNYSLIKNKPTQQILKIMKFSQKDIGTWICRDGAQDLNQQCTIARNMTGPEASLTASCDLDSSNKELITSCKGITSLGFPPVSVKINVDGTDESKTLLSPDYSGNVSVDAAGRSVVCSLDGPATQCVKESMKGSIKCPQVGLGQSCASDENCAGDHVACSDSKCVCSSVFYGENSNACGLQAGPVVGIALGILVIVGVIVGLLWYMIIILPRRRHCSIEKSAAQKSGNDGQNEAMLDKERAPLEKTE